MIKKILLIDDDYATNEYHKIIINNAKVCEELLVYQYADKALEWLKSINRKDFPKLILLDINMPRMNGFEFLEEYKKIFADSFSVIIMLTTSLHLYDREKAKKYNVTKFVNKPLTVCFLHSIDNELGIL